MVPRGRNTLPVDALEWHQAAGVTPGGSPRTARRAVDWVAAAGSAGGTERRRRRHEEDEMPKYLFRASYTAAGAAGLLKEGGTSRLKAISALVEGAGGKVEAAYWAMGADDFLMIADVPDVTAAAAASLTVGASGAAEVTTSRAPDRRPGRRDRQAPRRLPPTRRLTAVTRRRGTPRGRARPSRRSPSARSGTSPGTRRSVPGQDQGARARPGGR